MQHAYSWFPAPLDKFLHWYSSSSRPKRLDNKIIYSRDSQCAVRIITCRDRSVIAGAVSGGAQFWGIHSVETALIWENNRVGYICVGWGIWRENGTFSMDGTGWGHVFDGMWNKDGGWDAMDGMGWGP